jgi:hypothetical protein
MSAIDNGKMSASDLAIRQLTLDRMVKHLRKLRWIGRDQEADQILCILTIKMQKLLDARSLQTALPSDSAIASSRPAGRPAMRRAVDPLSRSI